MESIPEFCKCEIQQCNDYMRNLTSKCFGCVLFPLLNDRCLNSKTHHVVLHTISIKN